MMQQTLMIFKISNFKSQSITNRKINTLITIKEIINSIFQSRIMLILHFTTILKPNLLIIAINNFKPYQIIRII